MSSERRFTISSCTACPRRQETEWCDLPEADLKLLNSFKRERVFSPGEVLYHQGDDCNGIFCIRDGLVGERRVDANGNSALVRLNHAGTTLGYQELLTKASYRNSAEVLQESRICFLGRSVISELLANNPSLGERFLRRSFKDLEQTEDTYLIAINSGIRARLLHTLLVLYERYGRFEESEGHILELPIARHELANLIGTGPETISRTIRKLQDDELVRFDGRVAYFSSLHAIYDEIGAPE